VKTSITELRGAVLAKNVLRGIDKPDWNVVGSVRIGGDISGTSIDIVVNTSGGVRRVIYGATKSEAMDAVYGIPNEVM
jgi:hypothetical protein